MKKSKLIAYVVEPVEGKWDLVSVTGAYDDCKWVSGMAELTTPEDVLERANKNKVEVLPISMVEKE